MAPWAAGRSPPSSRDCIAAVFACYYAIHLVSLHRFAFPDDLLSWRFPSVTCLLSHVRYLPIRGYPLSFDYPPSIRRASAIARPSAAACPSADDSHPFVRSYKCAASSKHTRFHKPRFNYSFWSVRRALKTHRISNTPSSEFDQKLTSIFNIHHSSIFKNTF